MTSPPDNAETVRTCGKCEEGLVEIGCVDCKGEGSTSMGWGIDHGLRCRACGGRGVVKDFCDCHLGEEAREGAV